ncbi:MAG: nucleoside transporter C-terminal domain-containing protein [Litorimonas sp.]
MEHRAFGLIGIVLILLLAWIASDNRKEIRLRTVGACFALQVAIAVFVLYLPWGKDVLEFFAGKVTTLLSYADAGIGFVFGNLDNRETGFSFLVRVLPIIIFFAALMEVLYHLRIMQIIVRWGGSAIRWLTDTRPVESLNVIANIFVGQTEAPLSLKPYLPSISKPELFAIMVAGLASVSGTVLGGYIALGIEPKYLLAACFMSAPAALLMAKMIMPDTVSESKEEKKKTAKAVYAMAETGPRHPNVIMAAAVGAQNGLKLAVAIGAMLIAFIALIALCNGLLGWAGGWFGHDDLTLQNILGWIFSPVMWAVGIPWSEAQLAGGIFGEKVILNEFIAFGSLVEAESSLSPKSVVVLSFALCGFANISSIAILLGGLGTLIPDRMPDIARMGVKAVFAASLANLMSAALAGILVGL